MAVEAELHILSGERRGRIVLITGANFLIGRSAENDLTLFDKRVSRHHAVIRYHEGLFYVQDLDSATGTWLNTRRINASRLYHKDLVRFGDTEMEFILKNSEDHAGTFQRDNQGTEIKPRNPEEATRIIPRDQNKGDNP